MPRNEIEYLDIWYDPIKVLVESGTCKSRSEAKRLIKQGGVRINYKGEWRKIIKILNYTEDDYANL